MKLDRESIFNLYGEILKGNKESREKLLVLYKKHYPKNDWLHKDGLSDASLHTMFLHLDQKAK